MNAILAIARRELSALFFSPVGYLVLLVFSILASVRFLISFDVSEIASLRGLLDEMVSLLVFVAPAVSMRMISEELRSNTIEPLMTSPVSDTQIVLGKWIGAWTFFAVLMLPVFVMAGMLFIVADPDKGPIISGLVGLMFVGGLYLAIGLVFSALTDAQLTAYLLTVLAVGFLSIGLNLLYLADLPVLFSDASGNGLDFNTLKPAIAYMNVNRQYSDFAKGLIDIRHFVYFLSLIACFLFLTIKLVESRRWR